jgi:hypothetical protein
MKTYLALISIGILSLQSFVKAAEEMIKYPQSLRSTEVQIPQNYTPFGNRLEFNKFGDDGSSCVLDASGVLTWIDNDGTVRVLPNSDLAVPLYVTATECLVWNNRFVDYATYESRPNAELKLYRAAVGSTVLTEVALPAIAAKEILDTPPVTNTTSPLTFVASMRKDNGEETDLPLGFVVDPTNYSDDCELRVYRLTAGAGVQFLKNYNLQVKAAADFKTNSSGPNVSAIGYGSDGSVALEFADAFATGGYIVDSTDPVTPIFTPVYHDQVLWLDDQGRSAEVLNNRLVTGIAAPRVKILSATKTRLVYEVEQGGVGSFYDLRRNSTTGALAGTATLRSLPSAMTGNVAGYTQTHEAGIDFSNYSRVGDNKYFYTVGTLVGAGSLSGTSVISTYQITAADPILVNRAAPGIAISSSALVGTVNPADGSALLDDEDGESLIWLHTGIGYDAVISSATTGYSALPNSSQAKALFVSNEQAVIWENADAAKNPNGSIPAAIVKHYARDTTIGALTASPLALDGTTLLNTPRLTPAADYWLLTTAQKPQADTSTLRTYALRTASTFDSDNDGLTNGYEISVSLTDPDNPDTDDDGLSDGDEIEFGTDPFDPDTDGDGLSDGGKQFFGSSITVPDGNTIKYSNALVSVDYEGLVMDPVTGIAFKQKLTLTKTGSFTSTLLGLEGDYSYKGTFTSTGAFREDNPDNLQEMGGWLIVDMNLVYQDVSGTYYIQGYFENEAGDQISFELRPARKDTRYAGKKLNFEASVIGAPAGPTGSAVATGSIHKTTGVAIFTVYFPDGSRGSYSGPIVDGRDKGGNLLLPYSFGDLASSPLLVGISVLRTSANQSDVDGTVRLYSGTSDSANLYPDGFDQLRKLKGSFYVPPASSRLPLSTFVGINNTLYRWTDEGGNGLTGVGTWTPSKLSLSNGPAEGGSATVDRASGLVTVSRIPGIGSEMRQGKAVVLQTSKTVKGFYSSSDSMGSLVLAPNASKIPAAVSGVITPTSYSATYTGVTYPVTVKVTGPWAVFIPTDATWVTATLANTSGTPATPTLVDGSGNGTVTITLAANTTSSKRTAVIHIAGVEHTITQAESPPNSITPKSRNSPAKGETYIVKVIATGPWIVENLPFWVTASPMSGNGNGTVTITVAPNGTTVKTHKDRKTTIKIAGCSHKIKQPWK